MMRLLLVWIGVALGGIILVAGYWHLFPTNTTKQTLESFGLIGTWSYDCAGKGRATFTAPSFGAPMGTSINGDDSTKTLVEIKSATKLTDDKLKIVTLTIKVPEADKKNEITRQEGEVWQAVYERLGKKMRVLDIEREDAKKVVVKNGFLYQTKVGKEPTKTMNFALFG
jgi:hypothetical protein